MGEVGDVCWNSETVEGCISRGTDGFKVRCGALECNWQDEKKNLKKKSALKRRELG